MLDLPSLKIAPGCWLVANEVLGRDFFEAKTVCNVILVVTRQHPGFLQG